MYTTAWCGSCKRLMAQLDREGIKFNTVDIEHDPAAAAFVASRNGGNHYVPTVVMADGTVLPNPPIGKIKEHLGAGPVSR